MGNRLRRILQIVSKVTGVGQPARGSGLADGSESVGAADAKMRTGQAPEEQCEAVATPAVLTELDRLLGMLVAAAEEAQAAGGEQAGLGRAAGGASREEAGTFVRGDAIDQVLAGAPRVSGVVSLRDAPEVVRFRDELTDGLIRVDTANQLLRLINEVVVRLVR